MKKDVIKILEDAGKLLIEKEGNNKVHLKNNNYDLVSLVSEADIESEKLIIDRLSNLFPSIAIYSEESGFTNGESKLIWYVDPLDGTSNYTRGIPIWGISIALVENDQPIFGAIYLPSTHDIVYAEKGKGTFINDTRVHVSDRNIKESLYFSRSYYNKKLILDKNIGERVGLVKVVDSSSFELSQIATGNAEIYSMVSHPHDVAAGVILIREAGGKVTDFDGKEWSIASSGIVATNGIIHEEIIRVLDRNLFN